MLELFPTQDLDAVAKPKPFQSAMWSAIVHASVVLFLVSIPFLAPVEPLPQRLLATMLVAPAPPPPPPPPAPVMAAATPKIPVPRAARVFSPVLLAPKVIPQHVAMIAEPAVPILTEVAGVPGGVPGGIPGGVLGGILGGVPQTLSAPPPPPPAPVKVAPPKPATPERIVVDAGIQEAKLLNMVHPVYPPMAKAARIQGSVYLSAVIDRDGNITEVTVDKGNPLLVQAAVDAVRKWRYRPTFLHGEAVEVATHIIVVFHFTAG